MKITTNIPIERTALFSECGLYRYRLMRRWSDAPMVLFIMLNPSTADGEVDDPTIRRCMNYALSWGYGGIWVGNLFAYRATNPKWLLRPSDPVGPENAHHLAYMDSASEIIVCAWGSHAFVDRFKSARLYPGGYKPLAPLTKPLHYLEVAKSGHPKHPLYLKASLRPQLYEYPTAPTR